MIVIFLRQFFYSFLVRPLIMMLLGLHIRHLDKLEFSSSRIIAANHNSHLDAMVLMSLFTLKKLPQVKLVAAKDYFCRNRIMEWFSVNIIGIIPIDRTGASNAPLAPVLDALEKGFTIVLFPEGSRGNPEERQPLKFGIAKLVELNPEITVTPIFMHGLGKSLPKGEGLFVPFVCNIAIGDSIGWTGDKVSFINQLDYSFNALSNEINPKLWQ